MTDSDTNHYPVDWFTPGTSPSCSCSFAPGDNVALVNHWASLGIRWVDEHGTLQMHRITDNVPPEAGLPRALWRGRQLIDLGSDEPEPDENRLSDVLADLMHWADHNHVDFDSAVAQAGTARLAELEEWGAVQVRITSTYEDGHESEVDVWIAAPEDKDDLDEWWQDDVFEHTGDGHGLDNPKMGSYYEARILSTHPNDDALLGETYDWSD